MRYPLALLACLILPDSAAAQLRTVTVPDGPAVVVAPRGSGAPPVGNAAPLRGMAPRVTPPQQPAAVPSPLPAAAGMTPLAAPAAGLLPLAAAAAAAALFGTGGTGGGGGGSVATTRTR